MFSKSHPLGWIEALPYLFWPPGLIFVTPAVYYICWSIYVTYILWQWSYGLSSMLSSWHFCSLLAGLWSLTYEQELTTPLHITAGRGFADCLRLLLQRGADVDLAPGGTTALHEACENCQPECAKLLLMHGANANAVSEDGLLPLHVCTSPESLE